jgi:hypothetical protein
MSSQASSRPKSKPNRGKTKRKLKCFISAAAGINIGNAVRVLKELRVELIEAVPPAGTESLSSIRVLIEKSDFVLGIVADERGAASTLFEVGIAIGLGKPIVTVSSSQQILPNALRGFFSVVARPDDEEALRFNLPIFIKNLKHSAPANVIKTETTRRNVIPRAAGDRDQPNLFLQFHSDDIEKEIVQYLRSFLRATLVESKAPADKPDIVAWLPGLPSDFGNPILFEVKRHFRPAHTNELRGQLSKYFNMPGLKTAIVVYPSESPSYAEMSEHSYLFFINFDDLRRSLEGKNFNKLLIQLRNKAAHGAY